MDEAFRLTGYTTRAFTCLRPDAKPMVGYARTATCRSVYPGTKAGAAATELRVSYYAYVNQGDEPKISGE